MTSGTAGAKMEEPRGVRNVTIETIVIKLQERKDGQFMGF
jgi:hypothetical protein